MIKFNDIKGRTTDFLKDVEVEMTKITWPFLNDTLKSTLAVGFISAVLVIFLFGVDSLFSMIVKYVLA
ncbi:MAG: preprotein translocase subunit SecE [Deltaproteobacteria bacterium]|jgi:preprotein translocase SecE subunit|nr:MAG: preprotein translocase subunit SecE [Deltaproteobacteria bacterium]TDJ09128.1 MAG: preprotein translocase subunit SecE [Deltaproteobacteria bacterium]